MPQRPPRQRLSTNAPVSENAVATGLWPMRKLCFRQQCASRVNQGGESGLLPKLSFDRLIPMKRRLVLILAAGSTFALATTIYVVGQDDGLGPYLLEKQSRQLAGPNALDCGRGAPRAEPKKATDCALAVNKAGKPFRIRYDMRGIDSFVAVAFVRLPDGTVEDLSYDSDPAGGGGRAHEVVAA